MKVFMHLSWFFKQEKLKYIGGLLVLLFIALFQLIPPQIIGKTIDAIAADRLTGRQLFTYMMILAFAAVMIYILRYSWRVLIFGTSNKLGKILRNRLYEKYTSMSPSFFQRRRTGDLMAHATNDINAVQGAAGPGVLMIGDSLITGTSILITMALTINWKLTLIIMLPLPILVLLTSYYGRLMSKGFKKAQAAFSRLNDKTQESIAGIKVTKTMGYEKSDQKDFKTISDDVVRKNLKVAQIDALFSPTIMLVIGTSYFLALVFGTFMIFNHTITLGQLITATTYLGMLVWPLLALGFFFNIIQRGHASYERISGILDTENEIDLTYKVNGYPSGPITYQIKSFTFPGSEHPSLRDVHFTIEEGMTVGIVGRTSSGKSTLLRLLVREFDTQRPEDITYGGIPIRDYEIQHLRAMFGYVPQDNFLFSTTIRENIAFAAPNSTKQQIQQAAETSYVHHDILNFPQGYDTIVGERGVSLSGGQKQRVSIARAVISDPPVLMFDDSLSAVDADTEEHILNNMRDQRQGKTNIITAHRMSAVSHADLIIVMDEGTVAEQGTHEQLMRNQGWYAKTYQSQQLRDQLTKKLDEAAHEEEGDYHG
ncbi:ABC transporter transmembrane domain-containing protein [Staphylococcus simulans]|uniref:Multidrug ABC transporter ATP-binding protein n=1 Tax=Staphylococcus simulans UMC-CNS-990 TaxID=1405498 RepID=A0ABN0PFV4_STASI|nr:MULTISPECIES: ABC transporter transmembrane domain-containing protein [Staphylococcus]ERS94475.1 multidrug ABC transporter ATP-binding protein [Staphylococcus simulans UMC-CNS-990]KXA47005.1 ABC transporter, ATP-binding protein [Staphylococcus simulans]MBO0386725.1 ATP-binding cassette domain-containing protein [Staphylococcus simulans]MBU6942718.1 ATP-binding cassette domain-containing protein [Staphylococcus sp. CWZ226]MCE5149436.1 ATP-binding cassette domain-containing protein [Staphyloc